MHDILIIGTSSVVQNHIFCHMFLSNSHLTLVFISLSHTLQRTAPPLTMQIYYISVHQHNNGNLIGINAGFRVWIYMYITLV